MFKFSKAQWIVLVLIAAVGLWIGIAFEAPPPGFHGFHPRIQGLYIVSFLLVLLPLIWILAPRLKEHLRSRSESVRAEIEEAKAHFAEAEARLQAARERLENITKEVEALMAEFRALGEKERDALAHEGALLAEKIRKETDFAMSQAVKMARQEIRDYLVQRAIEMAKERLTVGVTDKEVDAFVKGIQGAERV